MSTVSAMGRFNLDEVQRWSLRVGIAALLPCLVGAFFDPQQFFRSYLPCYLFYQGIALGCLAILMVFYLTGGAWGFLIRRLLEAGMRTLPLLALLFLPVGCGLTFLYNWTDPRLVAADPVMQWRHIYLNVPFWWVRAVLYFAVWLGLSHFLDAWSRRQEDSGEVCWGRRLGNLSGPGLIAYGICMHFASVDWIMSLQVAFRSTIFGPLTVSGQVLSGLALVLVVLAWAVDRPPIQEAISSKALNDLGNLLLTFLVIWAYMVFFQFMLIWIANFPFEVIWYLDRSRGGWQWVAWALFLLHFVVPFFLLLMRPIKQNPLTLAGVAGLLLVMQLVFMDYQVLPAFLNTPLVHHWMDFLMPFGLGGIWLACYLWQLKRRPLLPQHDRNRAHAGQLREEDLEEMAREAART